MKCKTRNGLMFAKYGLGNEMTRDEIIEMAREAGAKPGIENEADAEFLERFAALVAAEKDNKIQELEDMILELQERME